MRVEKALSDIWQDLIKNNSNIEAQPQKQQHGDTNNRGSINITVRIVSCQMAGHKN